MGLVEIALVVVLLILLLGGGVGYQRRADWGPAPVSVLGLLVIIVVIVLVFRVL